MWSTSTRRPTACSSTGSSMCRSTASSGGSKSGPTLPPTLWKEMDDERMAHRGHRVAARFGPVRGSDPARVHPRSARRAADGRDAADRRAAPACGGVPPTALLRPRPRPRAPRAGRRLGVRQDAGAVGMSASSVVVAVLVGLGVAVELACCVGVLVMADAYDKLHYLGPASIVGPLLIAMAVLVGESFSQAGIKALLTAALLILSSPVLTHATARALYIRRRDHIEDATGRRQ